MSRSISRLPAQDPPQIEPAAPASTKVRAAAWGGVSGAPGTSSGNAESSVDLGGIGSEAAELMERVRKGDTAAFERLVDTFWRRTLIYIRHLCGDPDRAYDITQEAFTRLWEKREEWSGSGSVRLWLLRTARNLLISSERKLKVRAYRAFEVAREYPRVRTPLEETEATELRTAINRALRKLPPRRLEAFTLFHLQGLSYREISGIMGCRPQTAANYVQAALADLRVLLAPHFPSNLSTRIAQADDPVDSAE